jgi:D-threo-aldose 1-dehydrogenase
MTPASRLGLGGGPLGGLFAPVDETTAAAVVERAWEHGIRLFDVAPLYGHGRAERFVGSALRGKPRDEFTLSTKVGRLLRSEAAEEPSDFAETEGVGPVFDFSASGVRRSLEESLERLGLDRVDVLLIHDPEQHLDQAISEAQPELARLRDERVVRSIGVGTNHADTALRFVRETDVDHVLLANRITLLDRSGLEILGECVDRRVGVVAGAVFNSGVLAGPHPHARHAFRRAPDEIRTRVHAFKEVCERHGVSLLAAALRYPLRHDGVESVLVGARSVEEIDTDVAALGVDIPDELWAELDRG